MFQKGNKWGRGNFSNEERASARQLRKLLLMAVRDLTLDDLRDLLKKKPIEILTLCLRYFPPDIAEGTGEDTKNAVIRVEVVGPDGKPIAPDAKPSVRSKDEALSRLVTATLRVKGDD